MIITRLSVSSQKPEALRFYWSLSYGKPTTEPKPLEPRVIEYQPFQQTVHLPFYRFKEHRDSDQFYIALPAP